MFQPPHAKKKKMSKYRPLTLVVAVLAFDMPGLNEFQDRGRRTGSVPCPWFPEQLYNFLPNLPVIVFFYKVHAYFHAYFCSRQSVTLYRIVNARAIENSGSLKTREILSGAFENFPYPKRPTRFAPPPVPGERPRERVEADPSRLLSAGEVRADGRRVRAVGRAAGPEQHAGRPGGRRDRRRRRGRAVRQPVRRDGRGQRDRGRYGRARRPNGRQPVPRAARRPAAVPVRADRRVPGQRRRQRGPGPVPARRRARRPRHRQPVRVRLRPAAHQRAQAQPGVPGPVAGRGRRQVRPAADRQRVRRTRRHHAGRLPGPVGQGGRVQGRQRDGRAGPAVVARQGRGGEPRYQRDLRRHGERRNGRRGRGDRSAVRAAPRHGFRLNAFGQAVCKGSVRKN